MKRFESVEALWTVRRDDRSLRAELSRHHVAWEVHLFSDQQWFATQTVGSRERALVFADAIYDDFVAAGWVSGSKSIHASFGVSHYA